MAGIYVHIPFCHSRCAYCDFYSTTNTAVMERYIAALQTEMAARINEFRQTPVSTLYIGGGTPSLLTPKHLNDIISSIHNHYHVDADAELTVEMNPDDVGREFSLSAFRTPPNRVSLGIQTFDDNLLRLIHRRHDAQTAINAVRTLQEAGIHNISIDLIYGLPGQTMSMWENDLDMAFTLGIQHLSAYALSYEKGTKLWQWRHQGRITEVSEELSVAMYERLCQRANDEGFEHYEISNFALPHYHSRHNSAYWNGLPYLGFGPGAHSYDGNRTRRANLSNLETYIQYWSIREEADPRTVAQIETLTDDDLFDEAVMCELRTREGIDLEQTKARFGEQRLSYLLRMAHPHLQSNRLRIHQYNGRQYLSLTPQALMVSDDVMSDLML